MFEDDHKVTIAIIIWLCVCVIMVLVAFWRVLVPVDWIVEKYRGAKVTIIMGDGSSGKPADEGSEIKRGSFMQVGKCYFVRTVTYHTVGRLKDMTETELLFEEASWVADSGLWSKALETGELSEVEPYPNENAVLVSSVVDYTEWPHPLPRERK